MISTGESLAATFTDCNLHGREPAQELGSMMTMVMMMTTMGKYQYSMRDWTGVRRLNTTKNRDLSDKKNWCVA
jgi:hypothetical protein